MACGLLDWYMLTWLCKGCCSRTQARNEGEGRGDRKIEERKDTYRNRIKGTDYTVVSERSPTLFLLKEFKDAFFYGFHYHFKTKMFFFFFYYKNILKGFKFEFLKCNLKKGLCIFTRHPLPKKSVIDKNFTMLCTGTPIAWFHPKPFF